MAFICSKVSVTSRRDALHARVSDLDDLLSAVADVELTVNVTGSAIVVSLNGESLLAIAVEGVDESFAGDVDATHVGSLVKDEVHPGREGSAVGVGLHANGEVEVPSVVFVSNRSSIKKTEVHNVDAAVKLVRLNVAMGFSGLVLNSADIFPLNLGGRSTGRCNLDGVVETVGLKGLLTVVVVEPVSEFVAISACHNNFQVVVAASVVAVLSNSNSVGELGRNIINSGVLISLLEVEDLQVAWRVPKVLVS